jgi:hypothetical protein
MHRKRALRVMGKVTLWSWESSFVSEGVRISSGTARIMGLERSLNQSNVDLITRQQLNWAVSSRALCKLNDEVWVESEICSVRNINVNELADYYQQMRELVLESVQKRHVVDVGWICQTFSKKDVVDSNFELMHLGEITEIRKYNWNKSTEIENDN